MAYELALSNSGNAREGVLLFPKNKGIVQVGGEPLDGNYVYKQCNGLKISEKQDLIAGYRPWKIKSRRGRIN